MLTPRHIQFDDDFEALAAERDVNTLCAPGCPHATSAALARSLDHNTATG
ncbi:MAG TPA: hypothetical protein VGJ20_08165 [Xanthobacteraceae bacterium]